MTVVYVVGAILASALFLYLLWAMLAPEKLG